MAVDAVRLLVDLITGAEGSQTVGHLQDELYYSVHFSEVREIAKHQGIEVEPARLITVTPRAGSCLISDSRGNLIHTLYSDEYNVDSDISELLHEVWEYHWDYVVDWYYTYYKSV